MNKHTFAICAYKESEFLEECILSLVNQTIQSDIIVATSTPCDYINDLCQKYKLPLFINYGESGITQDWNFAYEHAKTEYVTIAHQDDVYHQDYSKYLLDYVEKIWQPIIFFTDYSEIREGVFVHENKLLKIKRLMLLPLRIPIFWRSRFIRRRILSLGSPICCPSVTFNKNNCPEVVFEHGFRADEDWEAWEMLSKRKGAFVYCTQTLTYHRIHNESETTKILEDSARTQEDYIMFRKFWPRWIANILTKVYGTSEKSNDI